MVDKSSDLSRDLLGRRGKTTRLPSMRAPRDLTLGGTPKKIFTPNIPARRDRSQPDNSPSIATTSQNKTSDKTEKGRGRGRGRGRGASNIVQSHSIFEQGPTQKEVVKKENYERIERSKPTSGGGGGGGGSNRKVIAESHDDSEESRRAIEDLLKDDFIDDDQQISDMCPVHLPLSTSKNEIKTEIKGEIKMEFDEHEDLNTMEDLTDARTDNLQRDRQTACEERLAMTCAKLFTDVTKSDFGEMVFIQLPDILPGIPPAPEDDSAPMEGNKDDQKTVVSNRGKLTEFSEGHIGKIRVRASGKTELVLGETVLDVAMGTPCAFLQDVVCIRTGEEEGSSMSVLSHINNKIVCTPNFDTLFTNSRIAT